MMDNNIIGIGLCIIIIILLIFKFYTNKNTQKTVNHFADIEYKTEILKELNYDISSIRNLAQLANNAYNKDEKKLYIPIDTTSPRAININELTIENDLIINKKSTDSIPIIFREMNNLNYYDLFYKGMIIPWAYDQGDIPANWALCDGDTYYYDKQRGRYMNLTKLTGENDKNDKRTNKDPNYPYPIVTTPNLTGRFILHENSISNVSSDYTNNPLTWTDVEKKPLGIHEINETGGEETIKLEEQHLPSHFHTLNTMYYDENFKKGMNTQVGDIKYYYDNYIIPFSQFKTEKSGKTFNTFHQRFDNYMLDQSKGGTNFSLTRSCGWNSTCGECEIAEYNKLITRNNLKRFKNNRNDEITEISQIAHENMPPWYALYYIMKLC